ncbi:MAG: hypothetical protein JWQ94_2263 [Tardiphaga sp.]|jgi:hypothetical protein|nr:hypothetical protein [Tardiphaga sp.]
MGTDFNIRPAGAPVAAPIVKPAPEAVRDAVPTVLPPDKNVGATDALLRPRISDSNYQQVDSDRISREVVIDKDAAAVVYVTIDKTTQQVVNQYPEQSRLRARAYMRALDTKTEDRRLETDRRA